jgi:ATP-dependent RNA helicase HelY
VWKGLEPAELAACVSALVYESRQPEDAAPPRLPPGAARDALGEMVRMWGALEGREHDHRLEGPREPDLGFAWTTWRWASGATLDAVLREADLQAGDFVRSTKQVIDLLGQVADAARVDANGPGLAEIGATARRAADLLRRGVVAYSGVA